MSEDKDSVLTARRRSVYITLGWDARRGHPHIVYANSERLILFRASFYYVDSLFVQVGVFTTRGSLTNTYGIFMVGEALNCQETCDDNG